MGWSRAQEHYWELVCALVSLSSNKVVPNPADTGMLSAFCRTYWEFLLTLLDQIQKNYKLQAEAHKLLHESGGISLYTCLETDLRKEREARSCSHCPYKSSIAMWVWSTFPIAAPPVLGNLNLVI